MAAQAEDAMAKLACSSYPPTNSLLTTHLTSPQ